MDVNLGRTDVYNKLDSISRFSLMNCVISVVEEVSYCEASSYVERHAFFKNAD